MTDTEREHILGVLKSVRGDLEEIRAAMESAERPTTEDCGIAWVCADGAIEDVYGLELDLITGLVPA